MSMDTSTLRSTVGAEVAWRARFLHELGLVHLRGVTRDQLTSLLQSVGRILHVANVSVRRQSASMVTSDEPLDLHTDHSRARYVALFCQIPASAGGTTIVADTRPALDALSDDDRAQLSEVRVREHRIFEGDAGVCRLLRMEGGAARVYYAPWLVARADRERPPVRRFREALASLRPARVRLGCGDLLLIDNSRMVHGRTRIRGDRNRHLVRFWLD